MLTRRGVRAHLPRSMFQAGLSSGRNQPCEMQSEARSGNASQQSPWRQIWASSCPVLSLTTWNCSPAHHQVRNHIVPDFGAGHYQCMYGGRVQ